MKNDELSTNLASRFDAKCRFLHQKGEEDETH